MSSSDCGGTNLPVVDFLSDTVGIWPGSAQSPTEGGKYTRPLTHNSQLSINGSTNLSGVIVGPNGAYVEKITYEHLDGMARYSVINVYGRGPKGTLSGSLKLSFLTEAGETHTLDLTSSDLKCRNDKFQDQTGIVIINWTH